jgi:hypothetical protein
VHKGFWWRNLWESDQLEKPRVEWRIILKLIFKKWYMRHGLDWSGSEQGQVPGSCEFGNEASSSIKSGEFIE